MSHPPASTDIVLAGEKPLVVLRPARRERSKGDQSLTTLVVVYAVILAIALAFAGFLLSITQVSP